MLDGVEVVVRKIFKDDKGCVMHMLRSDDALFKNFGEVYFSYVNAGCIKGWKKHSCQTQHFVVPHGNLKVVLFDSRESSQTHNQIQEVEIGLDNYQLLKIPPNIWYSFKALGQQQALITNCVDIPHDPQESELLDLDDKSIPYCWGS